MSLGSPSFYQEGVVPRELPRLQEPFISVVTVSLNAAEFIEHNLQSVAVQTYPHREHIVIDGGSTDGTVDIIKAHDPHLSYWHSRKDRGISHAFNLGLAQARGEWVLFLNADDFLLHATVLESAAKHLCTSRDVDVVYGERYLMTREAVPQLLRREQGRAWSFQKFRWRPFLPQPAAITNRSYFNRVGGFDEYFRIAMDYEIYLRDRQNLKAQYIPLAITGMREGGCSCLNIIKTWVEGRRAQKKTKALPGFLSWVNFYFQIGRHYLALLYRKLLK